MARRRSLAGSPRRRSLSGLGFPPYTHLQEAMDYTRMLERRAKAAITKSCPSPESLVDDGETIGKIKANLNYSNPSVPAIGLEARFAPLHKDTTKRFMDAVLEYKKKIRAACGDGALKGLAGRRRRSRR